VAAARCVTFSGAPQWSVVDGAYAGCVVGDATVTLFFTDLVDSTELLVGLGEDRFDSLRDEHDELVAGAVDAHHGEIVKHTGDGCMAAFARAADAVEAAAEIERLISRRNERSEVALGVRIGISAGDVTKRAGDYHGMPAVEAARLCAVATGGQILASEVVRSLVGSRGGHDFVALGELDLKGLPPLATVAVRWRDDAPVFAPAGGAPSGAVQLRLLGPLEVVGLDGPIVLSTPKLRTLLVRLALSPNEVVSEARLIDALWGEDVPRTAAKTLQNHVLRLRRALRSGRAALTVETEPGGYRLDVSPGQMDVAIAEQLVADGRAVASRGDHQGAAAHYRKAEALWRGPSLDGFAEQSFAMGEAARLDELRRCAFEERVDVDLALGRHADLVAELEAGVMDEPLRERRWGQLMLALYRSGRQADALRAYQRLRTILGEELGLEPGEELRSLERAIVTSDPALGAPAASVHVAPLPSGFVPWAGQPFVGRQGERDRLEAALGSVIDTGARRLVVISGEPGIGKTCLAAKLAVDARAHGAAALFGRCEEGLDAPFQPFVEALEQLLGATDVSALVASLGGRAERLAVLLPAVQAQLSQGVAPAGDSVGERHALFDAIDAVFENVSASVPVVLVLDDLHWADATSLMLLRYLARSPRPARLLMVGTYRHTELDRTHPLAECLAELRTSGRVDRLSLHGLGTTEVRELLASWHGETPPEAFVAALRDQTEGNPFFIEEVLRHLGEDGATTLGHLPEGVRDVIDRRLSHLPPAVNETLRVAAVIGNEFDVSTLAGAAGSSRDDVLGALDAAIAAELVTEMPESFGAFAFTHALVRQTLYRELGAGRRAQLHWRVGQSLAVAHPDDLHRRASHLAAGVVAGEPRETVDAAVAAGGHAREVLAFEQAVEQYARAIAILDGTGLDDADRRYWALEGLGAAHLAMGNQNPSQAALLEAADVARAHGWADRLADVALLFRMFDVTQQDDAGIRLNDEALGAIGHRDDPRIVGLLGMRSIMSAAVLHRLDLEDADAAVAMARRLEDPAALRLALNYRAMAYVSSPRLDKLFEACNEAITASTATSPSREHAGATRALALACLRAGDRPGFEDALAGARSEYEKRHEEGSVYLMQVLEILVAIADGKFADAERLGREVVERFSGYPSVVMITTAQLGGVQFEQGGHAELIPGAERVMAEVPKRVYWSWVALLATACHDVGRTDDARRIFDRYAAHNWAKVPEGWMHSLPLRHLAELCVRFADRDRAASLRPLVEPWAGQLWIAGTATSLEGAADRALGQLDTVLGEFDKADSEFEAALALERCFGAEALIARTLYWFARMLRTRDTVQDRVQAACLLDEALETTARLGMAMLNRQCEALRDRVT
jgi:DNA-binding SARP family transcriptional activator/class 3 adenylate cyclase